MKKIVLCIDFSDFSDVVLKKGAELAKAFDSSILLLHATHAPIQVGQTEFTAESVRHDVAEYFHKEHKQLQEMSDELKKQDIEARALVVEGSPSAEIVHIEAKKFGADLIIVGSKGHGRLSGLFLGSFSQKLLESITVPILVVPD